MNFLSHYHFYKNGDPYFNTGLVMPDMVRTFCKVHLKPQKNFIRPALSALNKGCIVHLEADKKFHNSVTFQKICDQLAIMLDAEAGWPRKWFLNHLLTEILIDRVLMDRHENLCSDFYTQLQNTDQSQLTLFLKLSGIPNYQNFASGFERFVNLKFISDYEHNEKIILALNRVYMRLGINYEWTEQDKDLLKAQIPQFLKFIDENLNALELEIKL